MGKTFDFYLPIVANNDRVNNVKMSFYGPLFIKFERGIDNDVGVGINMAWESANVTYNYNSDTTYFEQDKYSSLSFLFRCNYHFKLNNNKVDFYWGLGAGFRWDNISHSSNNPENVRYLKLKKGFHVGFDTTLGIRKYLTPHIGLYVEAGIAKAMFQCGLTGTIGKMKN